MILTCPDCATRYFVDDRRLGPLGRTVRCASCGSKWHADAEQAPLELTPEPDEIAVRADEPLSFKAVEPQDLPAPELPKAFRAKAEQRRRVRRAAATGAVWTGLAFGFAALMFAAWAFRVDVVRVFPRAAAAYALVRVNATGLQFEGVNAAPSVLDAGSVVVQGRVRNIVSMAAPVPLIRVALVDKRGFKLKTQIVKLDRRWIAPNDTQSFRAVLPDPKAAAADVDVSFALDLAAEPKHLASARPLAVAAPSHPAEPALSQPAPILRPALPTPSAPPAANSLSNAPAASPFSNAPAANSLSNAPAAPAHAAQGLRGLDSGGPRG
jgi:predicted Zn finger-like uncharacterized protein